MNSVRKLSSLAIAVLRTQGKKIWLIMFIMSLDNSALPNAIISFK